MESTIIQETPVHITTHIKWLNTASMDHFKQAYQTFLQQGIN